jgi:hypothetical protein
MKKLILPLIFLSFPLYSAGPAQEIIDPNAGKEIVSMIKDVEIKDMLEKTSEFKDCREMNKFKSGADDNTRNQKIKEAEDCFKKKLGKDTDGKKLQELSEKLNLQNYGLVRSNNVKDIQKYLNDKMYESMTGINRNEADKKKLIESMKFGKKKHIDQKLFITLYKSQLSKNALYEISRFCFEDLRLKSKSGSSDPTTFADHWGTNWNENTASLGTVTDIGTPKFGKIQDTTNKSKIYEDLFASLNVGGSNGFPTAQLSKFFIQCGLFINGLCNDFKVSKEVATTGESDVNVQKTRGAAACLAKNRIQEIKKALGNADLVEKEFEKMAPTAIENALMSGQPIKHFGTDPKDESIDNLTNYTSKDVLEGGYTKNQKADQIAENCAQTPEIKNCEGLIMTGDALDKAKFDIDSEMALKREVELARVRELKAKGDAKLQEYLETNGYFEMLEKEKAGTLTKEDLEKFISAEFEAKKVATLAEINSKLGARQAKKDASGKESTDGKQVKDVIDASKEERARLAQVVLFNNIITSHLELTRIDDKGNASSAGRNVNAWKKEETALGSAKVNSNLFDNLKTTDDGKSTVKGIGQNENVGGMALIDKILGKSDSPNP